MTAHWVYRTINYAILAVNILVSILCFGLRRKPDLPMVLAFAAMLAFNTCVYFHPVLATVFENVPVAIFWFAVLLYYNKGKVFSKLFIYVGTLFITMFLNWSCSLVAQLVCGYETDAYYTMLLILVCAALAIYSMLMFRYGPNLRGILFVFSRPIDGLLYLLAPSVALVIMGYCYMTQGIVWYPLPLRPDVYYFLPPFSLAACYVFILVAIVSTYEKAEQKFESAFVLNIVSIEHGHYKKLEDLYDKLRILRHDTKYLINAAREMLFAGDAAGASMQLRDVETQLAQLDITKYCENASLNALVANYQERCQALDIRFDVDIYALGGFQLPNYELCIIVGNLLENALEASARLHSGRSIAVKAQRTATQYILMVTNNFDGALKQEDDRIVSLKEDGGLGLRSIRTILTRYHGEMITEWTDSTFTAYLVFEGA